MSMKNLLLLAFTLLVTACTASVEQLAQQGEWRALGYADGIKGHHSRSFSELQKLGQANQSDYDIGYLEGVNEYCNPDFAYQIGLSGQYYEGVCEGMDDAQRFRMEWQRGWEEAN